MTLYLIKLLYTIKCIHLLKKDYALSLINVNTLYKENIGITVFLINGYQIKGTVKAFDNYILILGSEDKQQMIYKHAISTIIPNKTIDLYD